MAKSEEEVEVRGENEEGKKLQMVNQNEPSHCVSTLPNDVIFNIFTRISAKTLRTWMSVCKEWQGIISDPFFVHAHLQRSVHGFLFAHPRSGCSKLITITGNKETRSGTSNWSTSNVGSFLVLGNEMIYDFGKNCIGESVALRGTCDGLVCLESLKRRSVFYIANPVSREWVVLPQSKNPSLCFGGFAFDHSINRYKLIHFMKYLRNRRSLWSDGFEVLTLGSHSWRQIQGPIYEPRRGNIPILTDGVIHWMDQQISPVADSREYIISFEVGSERFRRTRTPDVIKGFCNLLKVKNSLAFVDSQSNNSHLDIWILKDYEREIWIKQYSITMDVDFGKILATTFLCKYYPLAIWDDDEVIIFKQIGGIHLYHYDVRRDVFTRVKTHLKHVRNEDSKKFILYDHVVSFVSPSALVNGII